MLHKKNLLIVAGAVWLIAGINVLRIGILTYQDYHSIVNYLLSVVVFLLFHFMATVSDRIREIHDLLTEREVTCSLEWNPGNHFKDPDLRTAKAFAWLLHDSEIQKAGEI